MVRLGPSVLLDRRDLATIGRSSSAGTGPRAVGCAAASRRRRRSAQATRTCERSTSLAVEHDLRSSFTSTSRRCSASPRAPLAEGSLTRQIRDLGVLDERSCIVHAVWIDEADIQRSGRMRRDGRPLAVRQSPLWQRADAVPRLLDAGVTLALCTDEATVEDTNNLWNVARLAALLHKNAGPDFDVARPPRDPHALTIGGARATRLAGEIGELRPALGPTSCCSTSPRHVYCR